LSSLSIEEMDVSGSIERSESSLATVLDCERDVSAGSEFIVGEAARWRSGVVDMVSLGS